MKVSVPNTVAAGAIAIGTFLSPTGQDPIGIGYRIYSDASQKPVQEEVVNSVNDPIDQFFTETSKEINQQCSNLDKFMVGWEAYTTKYAEDMELDEQFNQSTAKQEKRISSSQYHKEIFEAACQQAQNAYGREFVEHNTDQAVMYPTLQEDLKIIIDSETYYLLSGPLQKRLHTIEDYDDLTEEELEEIVEARRELRPQNLIDFENALIAYDLRRIAREQAEAEESGYAESEFYEDEAETIPNQLQMNQHSTKSRGR